MPSRHYDELCDGDPTFLNDVTAIVLTIPGYTINRGVDEILQLNPLVDENLAAALSYHFPTPQRSMHNAGCDVEVYTES